MAALLFAAGPALAQPQPAAEPGAKLAFPQTVGGTTLSRSFGSTYQYVAPNGMEITVDAYGSRVRVPNGSSHPTIINEFNEQLSTISQQAANVGMKGFEKPAVPSACTYGQYTLRCIVFSVQGGSATGRIFGKFLLIGYREHFVKIIVRWSQTSGQTNADADKVLAAFVPALLTR
ncbi:MAG TPA: hypothetical protein VEC60_19615 [Reyranella sp.]|nr:hypothetical protein [Reyranella sp.]